MARRNHPALSRRGADKRSDCGQITRKARYPDRLLGALGYRGSRMRSQRRTGASGADPERADDTGRVTVTLPGPIPLSRVWTGSKVLAEDLAGEDLADVLDLHADALAWWVLERSSPYGQEELRRLAKVSELDDLAVTDLTAEDRRAKFEQLGQARLVVTNAIVSGAPADDLIVQPLSLLITESGPDLPGGVSAPRSTRPGCCR